MKIEIVVGSVLGASEYVAEACAALLAKHGHESQCHFTPKLSDIDTTNPMLVITSTHGAGDLPENIEQFAKDIQAQSLSGLNALVIGLGDSSYDTFCQASTTLTNLITQAGGKVKLPVYQIDVLHHPIPEDTAVEWLSNHLAELVQG